MAMQVQQLLSSRWQEAISESFIVIPFSHYNMGVTKLLLHSGVDLGFTERITLSIESLKQGVWGAQPLRSYRVFNFV